MCIVSVGKEASKKDENVNASRGEWEKQKKKTCLKNAPVASNA